MVLVNDQQVYTYVLCRRLSLQIMLFVCVEGDDACVVIVHYFVHRRRHCTQTYAGVRVRFLRINIQSCLWVGSTHGLGWVGLG